MTTWAPGSAPGYDYNHPQTSMLDGFGTLFSQNSDMLEELRRRRQFMMQNRGWGPNRQQAFMQGQTPNSPMRQPQFGAPNPINPFQTMPAGSPGAGAPVMGATPGLSSMRSGQPTMPSYNPLNPFKGATY